MENKTTDSFKFNLRMPKSLHKRLQKDAQQRRVSVNQQIVDELSNLQLWLSERVRRQLEAAVAELSVIREMEVDLAALRQQLGLPPRQPVFGETRKAEPISEEEQVAASGNGSVPLTASVNVLDDLYPSNEMRITHVLEAANCETIGDVVARTQHEWMQERNFGRVSLRALSAALEQVGHRLTG